MFKNIDKQAKLCLKDLVDYRDGQIVSRTLVQNNLVSMTLFSFDKGEEISTHAAGGDAMVTVLEGTGPSAGMFSSLRRVKLSSCRRTFRMLFLARRGSRCSSSFLFDCLKLTEFGEAD